MRRVCVTIDTEFPDRPCSSPLGTLEALLQTLASRSVPATFFVVGSWARAHPEQVRAIRAAGHQVGNHTYSHCNLARLSAEGIVADLTECQQALSELGIESRPWFRAPYGEMTSEAAVPAAVKRAGYRHVPWHADGEDWRSGPPDEVAARALTQIRRRWPRSATVLFHSWPDGAADALALLLDELAGRGAEFARLEPSRWRRP